MLHALVHLADRVLEQVVPRAVASACVPQYWTKERSCGHSFGTCFNCFECSDCFYDCQGPTQCGSWYRCC